jgi:predicted transposase YbfD/YdcC
MEVLTLTIACPRDARPPMTSSPILPARSQYLLDLLAQIPDPRKRRGRRHPLAGLLAVGIAAVIGNMPTLYRQLKKLPWARVPAASSVSTDHGRRSRRTIKAVLAPAWIGFAGAAQVAQLRRTVTAKGKKTVEVVYLITSDRQAEPAALAAWVRGHWHIENKLHWVRSPGATRAVA